MQVKDLHPTDERSTLRALNSLATVLVREHEVVAVISKSETKDVEVIACGQDIRSENPNASTLLTLRSPSLHQLMPLSQDTGTPLSYMDEDAEDHEQYVEDHETYIEDLEDDEDDDYGDGDRGKDADSTSMMVTTNPRTVSDGGHDDILTFKGSDPVIVSPDASPIELKNPMMFFGRKG